ncbi:hypothetical protein D3C81_1537230 [compost metagenome]
MTIQYQIYLMLFQYRCPQLSDVSRIIDASIWTAVKNRNLPFFCRFGQIVLQPLLLLFILVFTIQNHEMNVVVVKGEVASLETLQPIAWLIEMSKEIIVFLRTHNLMVTYCTDQGGFQQSLLSLAEPPFPFLFIESFIDHISDMNHELGIRCILERLFHRVAP